MATEIVPGHRRWTMNRRADGHREYEVAHLVRAGLRDGPANVLQTAGLPLPGSYWLFFDDVDVWAWCRLDARVSLNSSYNEEPGIFWDVVQKFSTEPLVGGGGGGGQGGGGNGGGGGEGGGGGGDPGTGNGGRCNEQQIEDPLLEPPRLSGGFTSEREEALHAMKVVYYRGTTLLRTDGPLNLKAKILNSAHEQIRGPQNEWDTGYPTFRVEQNVLNLEYSLMNSMVFTVNDAPIWGMPSRSIRLAKFAWERKMHGLCYVFFTRIFDFEIKLIEDPTDPGTYLGGWDREVLDEGTKVLKGHWDPNQPSDNPVWVLETVGDGVYPDNSNPSHFIKAVDSKGNPMKLVLNGSGLPANCKYNLAGVVTDAGDPGSVKVYKYLEKNFLIFGF